MKPCIILNSETGIGNRLQGMFSSWFLSYPKHNFYFSWPLTKYCNSTFNALFNSELFNELQICGVSSYVDAFQPKHQIFIDNDFIPDNLQEDELAVLKQGYVFNDSENTRIDVLAAMQGIFQDNPDCLEANIKYRQARDITHSVHGCTAIHIRGGIPNVDDVKDISQSSLFISLDVYDKFIEENLSESLCLFSENQEVLDFFLAKYKDKIKIRPTISDYRNPYFTYHAMLNMYEMSKCSHIVGPNSSFSQFAALWGNVPRTILNPVLKKDIIHDDA